MTTVASIAYSVNATILGLCPDVTTPQNSDLRPSEAGFVLPLVLIIVAIGAMVVIGLLGYASGLLRAGGEDADALKELYAADAGVAYVKKLLEQGPLPTDIPPIEINGLAVTMAVTPVATPGTAVPTPWPRPVDPGLPEEELLGPHLVTLYSVPEGTKADISWAFTRLTPTPTATPTPTPIPLLPNITPTPTPTPTPSPIPTYPSLTVYAGLGGGTPIATTEPLTELRPGRKRWLDIEDVELLGTEEFVVDFNPGTLTDLVSDPFTEDSQKCDSPNDPFFCLTTTATDYIVVSTAGQTTVTAYLRQIPEWIPGIKGGINYTFSGAQVVTLSWKPYPPDE